MRRQTQQNIDVVLSGIGVAVILGAVAVSDSISRDTLLLLVVLGILISEAGVWGVAGKMTPTERAYSRLRTEGDKMISLIRQLNAAAVSRDQGQEDDSRFLATKDQMHSSVEQMAAVAGIEDNTETTSTASKDEPGAQFAES